MKSTLTIKEAADKLAIPVTELVRLTVTGKIKKVRGQRGEPFRYSLDTVNEYLAANSRDGKDTMVHEPEKQPVKPVKPVKPKVAPVTSFEKNTGAQEALEEKELLSTQEAADYLGVKRSAVTMATSKGILPVSVKSKSANKPNLYSRKEIDKYKRYSNDFRRSSSFASKSGSQWNKDGGKTAIKLMKYAESHGHNHAWEAIKALLDANEKAAG